jgi:hypothetical protein
MGAATTALTKLPVAGLAVLSVVASGCGGGDTTTVIQTVDTTTVPAQTTTTVPTAPTAAALGSEHIPNPTANDYREPLSVWPAFDDQTKGALAALFLNNNPIDCGALIEKFEDAPIGVQQFVDRAANEPRLQDEPISSAMLVYCQKFSGG